MAFTLRDERPENGLCTTCSSYSHRVMSNGTTIKLCMHGTKNSELPPVRLPAPVTSCSDYESASMPWLIARLAWSFNGEKFFPPGYSEYAVPRKTLWQWLKGWFQ